MLVVALLTDASGKFLKTSAGFLMPFAPLAGIARHEDFYSPLFVDAEAGTSYGITRPTKYGSNPVFGDSAWTWDMEINYEMVFTDITWPSASRYRMFYSGASTTGYWHTCYAYSSDGYSWTKPNVGVYTYGGNTNNNIIIDPGFFGRVQYNPSGGAGQKYLMVVALRGATSNITCQRIYGADNPTGPYSLLKNLGDGGIHELMSLIQRSDGRWLMYYQDDYDIDKRVISAWLSNTSDLTGTWIDQGAVITTSVSTNQKYSIRAIAHGGLIYAFVARYNSTSEQIDRIQPWVSPLSDGLSFTLKDADWVSLGAGGTWDDEMVTDGAPVRVGNEWWHYYSGFPLNHPSWPNYAKVGIAKMGYDRLGYVYGNGSTLTTTAFVPDVAHLYLNCDASGGGKIEIELLNAGTGLPIANYAQADCDDVTVDSVTKEVTWGSGTRTLLTGVNLKIKFYITGAGTKLYGYSAG